MDIKIGLEALNKQSLKAKKYWRYYSGDHPLIYSAERLADVFGYSKPPFIQNWCSVVINSINERLVFKGWDSPNNEANNALDEFYSKARLSLLSNRVHEDALVAGNGYLMWDIVDGEYKLFYQMPTQTVVVYSDDDPEAVRFGMKTWQTEDRKKLNIYYPNRIEYYEAPKDTKSYKLVNEGLNSFGRVPIVHFKIDVPELKSVIPLQDAINKIFADMMVAGEFSAFPQRYILTNADISSLTSSPGTIQQIPKGSGDEEGTQIGQFESMNLRMYLEAIDKLAETIAVISRTPKHYFMSTGANISGEALTVMESSLVKKVGRYAAIFSDQWLNVAGYMVADEDVSVTWEQFETEQIYTTAQAMQIMINCGIPLVTVLKRFGWSELEVQQLEEDIKEQKKNTADYATEALQLAQMRLEQNNEPLL